MALVDATFVKDKFELWEDYCTIPGSSKTADDVLNDKIEDAENEFLQYLSVTEADITGNQKRLLMNIIRYNCFRVKHGDTEFDHEPQIIQDYKSTIEYLKRISKTDSAGAFQDLPSLSAKTRIFKQGDWFVS